VCWHCCHAYMRDYLESGCNNAMFVKYTHSTILITYSAQCYLHLMVLLLFLATTMFHYNNQPFSKLRIYFTGKIWDPNFQFSNRSEFKWAQKSHIKPKTNIWICFVNLLVIIVNQNVFNDSKINNWNIKHSAEKCLF
jgi:hypothetical protein